MADCRLRIAERQVAVGNTGGTVFSISNQQSAIRSEVPMMAPAKLDLYREHRDEYVAPRDPTLIDVAPARYLAITGHGKPGGPEFANAVGALYTVSFTT